MGLLFEALEIFSILHILPTLWCIVTAGETLTLPLLLFAFSQSLLYGWRASMCVCFFVYIYKPKFVWVALSFISHISKVTNTGFVWVLDEGEKLDLFWEHFGQTGGDMNSCGSSGCCTAFLNWWWQMIKHTGVWQGRVKYALMMGNYLSTDVWETDITCHRIKALKVPLIANMVIINNSAFIRLITNH